MSYHDLPDPRPLGVRFTIGPLPRYGAIAVLVCLIGLALSSVAGLIYDRSHFGAWGVVAIFAGLLSAQTAYGIHWMNEHKAWPRRRVYRRHRQMR
jgi:hypothetical protein